jgi:glutamate-1-semialdehyde 2,1-aminomutase
VIPDLTTMAKIVTGGMPGGALGGKAEVMRTLDPTVDFRGMKPGVLHKGTFNGSPLVAAAAVTALSLLKSGDAQEQANKIADLLRKGMQQVLDELEVDGLVYGEASTFHAYFGRGARQRSIFEVPPDDIRSMKREALDIYQNGLRKRGVDFMSYTGGVTSAAHTEADIPPTLEAFAGAVEDLVAAEKVARL